MVQLFMDGGGFMYPILIIFIIGLGFVLETDAGQCINHVFEGVKYRATLVGFCNKTPSQGFLIRVTP